MWRWLRRSWSTTSTWQLTSWCPCWRRTGRMCGRSTSRAPWGSPSGSTKCSVASLSIKGGGRKTIYSVSVFLWYLCGYGVCFIPGSYVVWSVTCSGWNPPTVPISGEISWAQQLVSVMFLHIMGHEVNVHTWLLIWHNCEWSVWRADLFKWYSQQRLLLGFWKNQSAC